MRIFVALVVYLSGLHYSSIEARFLGCDVNVKCAGDTCFVRFYCP